MWCGQAKLQRLLLRWAVKLLKPGGTLVFSTCTINPAENEANVTPQHPHDNTQTPLTTRSCCNRQLSVLLA